MKTKLASVALAVTTYYPQWYKGKLRSIKHSDKVRGDLALQFIRKVKELGCHIVIVDGKSTKTFKKELRNMQNIIIFNYISAKRSPARRQAIKAASTILGVKVVIITEPEKISLLGSLDELIRPITQGNADIVVPKREEGLFKKTFPSYMYASEIEANGFYNESLRANGMLGVDDEDLDMFFGPRVIRNNRETIHLFMRKYDMPLGNVSFQSELFDTEDYSNALFFPVVLALKKRKRVESVTIPFSYPSTQKENEEKGARDLFLEKRRSQRLSILVELLHFVSYLQKNRNSRVRFAR